LLLAAAVLQPSTGFDQRYDDEDEAAREAHMDAEFKAKQKARPTTIQPTAPGSVQTYRLGCVNPEAAETSESVKAIDTYAAECVDDDAPYFSLSDDGLCSCTQSYDAAAVRAL